MKCEYLSVPELAALLGKSPSWVYKNHKKWPSSLIGGEVKFDEEDIATIRASFKRTPHVPEVRRIGTRARRNR